MIARHSSCIHRIKQIIKECDFGNTNDDQISIAKKLFTVFYHINNQFDDFFVFGEDEDIELIQDYATIIRQSLLTKSKDDTITAAIREIDEFHCKCSIYSK